VKIKHHLEGTKSKKVSSCVNFSDDVKEIFIKQLQGKEKSKGKLDSLEEGKEGTSNILKQKTMNELCKNRTFVISEIGNCV